MKKTHWILTLTSAPWWLTVSLLVGLLLKLFGLAGGFTLGSDGVVTAHFTPRAAKYWHYSTTLGRLIVYHPNAFTWTGFGRLAAHERTHIRQADDLLLVGLFLGLVAALVSGNWLLGLGIWWSGGAWQLVFMLTACLRWGFSFDVAYRDAEHERSAYAQTDLPEHFRPFYAVRDTNRTLTAEARSYRGK